MKRKREEVRQIGQRSIASPFVFRVILEGDQTSNEKEVRKPSNSSISLSEFLSRKVDKPNYKAIQEKRCSFTSVTSRISDRNQKSQNKESKTIVNGSVFQNFQNVVKGKDRTERNGEDEVQEIEYQDDKVSATKGNNPFAVSTCSGPPTRSRYLVVLGDDPKPKQMRRSSFTSKRPDHIFNHYANGSGWWDSSMAGVDQEEVGCKEAWESMGATTLGGLEWH